MATHLVLLFSGPMTRQDDTECGCGCEEDVGAELRMTWKQKIKEKEATVQYLSRTCSSDLTSFLLESSRQQG